MNTFLLIIGIIILVHLPLWIAIKALNRRHARQARVYKERALEEKAKH